jgi:hypothetical protein
MDDFLKAIVDNEVVETRLEKDNKLVSKWQKFGLFKGVQDASKARNLARLYENQKNQIKRQIVLEQTSMAGGDIQGFAAVALPIIRRVFGNLVATSDVVSVQSMDQPVGLVFVLDFLAGTNKGGMGLASGTSIYGGGRVGVQILSGVNLTGSDAEAGFYALNYGYSGPSGSWVQTQATSFATALASGTVMGAGNEANNNLNLLCRYDLDLSGSSVIVLTASKSNFAQLNEQAYMAIVDKTTGTGASSGTLIKRLTQEWAADRTKLLLFYSASSLSSLNELTNTAAVRSFNYQIYDNFQAIGGVLSAIGGTTPWGFEFDGSAGQNDQIPEIDLQVTAFNIQTHTKMLRAKWTAQVSQDLAAWQNMDAEVELTSVLSEQIAMEIDMEILKDLVEGAKATVRYWSRRPGRYVNPNTGVPYAAADSGDFTGNETQWYKTLLIRVNDVSALIARKVLRGGATFIVTSPEVQSILESTNEWSAATTVGESDKKGTAGLEKTGSITNKWDVLVSPYFNRNFMLIGRKGSSNLETGYVYAPYIPMITSPTIPNPDNLFVYNKGVMTRYGKKMIRPDYYALLIVLNHEG